jgi:hypothetical protein
MTHCARVCQNQYGRIGKIQTYQNFNPASCAELRTTLEDGLMTLPKRDLALLCIRVRWHSVAVADLNFPLYIRKTDR